MSDSEQRLAGHTAREAPHPNEAEPSQSKWATLARSYRENPNLRGHSEELNRLLREVREELVL